MEMMGRLEPRVLLAHKAAQGLQVQQEVMVLLELLELLEVKAQRGQLDLLVAMARLAQQGFKVILELLVQLV
jgi:hypothetical protein